MVELQGGHLYCLTVTLPEWLQPVAWLVPTSHVFEGMRAVLFDRHFDTGMFLWAVALNVAYLITGAAVFLRVFAHARDRGLLLQTGE